MKSLVEELSIPCVIQGWRLIYLHDVLTFFSGKALLYACLYIYAEKYYKQKLKSVEDNNCLKFEILTCFIWRVHV